MTAGFSAGRWREMMRPTMVTLGIVLVLLTVWDTQIRQRSDTSLKLDEQLQDDQLLGTKWLSEQHKEPQPSSEILQPHAGNYSHDVDYIPSDNFKNFHSSAPDESDESRRRLIDFGVVGFEKCGTTFLLEKILSKSKQVFMAGAETGSEVHALYPKDLDQLQAMFRPRIQDVVEGVPVRRGFKNPMLYMNQPWLQNLQDHFPTLKFIVTVRHPVTWFQSWYNYKLRTGKYVMPTPHETIGLCREACDYKGPEGHCITVKKSPGCSGHSNYHQYLSRMGYTDMNTEEELSLLGHHEMEIFNFSQTKLFLTEMGQMDGKNTTVSQTLIRTMEDFLDLQEHALPDVQPYKPPNYTWTQDKLDRSIDICHDEYQDIRVELLDVGRKAGLWIEHYFLKSPHVVVADREDFLHRIRQWKKDPCKS